MRAGYKTISVSYLKGRPIEAAVLLLLAVSAASYGGVLPWTISLIEIIAVGFSASWLDRMVRQQAIEWIPMRFGVWIALLFLYWGIIVMSPFSFMKTAYQYATAQEMFLYGAYILIGSMLMQSITKRAQLERIIVGLSVMGFIISIIFVLRCFGRGIPGGFINRNHFCAFVGMIIPSVLGFFIARQSLRQRYLVTQGYTSFYAQQTLLLFGIVVMGAAVFLSMSRAGIAGFLAAMIFMASAGAGRASLRGRIWQIAAALMLLAVLVQWLAGQAVSERLWSLTAKQTIHYLGGRFPLWQTAWDVFKRHPLFGTGLGTFPYVFTQFHPDQTMRYTHAHNDILEFLAENGLIGFLLATMGVYFFTRMVIQILPKRHDPWVVSMSLGCLGSLVSIAIHSFFDFSLHIPANALLMIIVSVVLIATLFFQADASGESVRFPQKAVAFSRSIPRRLILKFAVGLGTAGFIVLAVKPAIGEQYFRAALKKRQSAATVYEFEEASALLKRALWYEPKNAEYSYQLGKTYLAQSVFVSPSGAYDTTTSLLAKALDAYQRAVVLSPQQGKYYQSLGWAYEQFVKLGIFNDARALAKDAFKSAVRLEPYNTFRSAVCAHRLFPLSEYHGLGP